MYTDDSEKRHSKRWIKKMFPKFNVNDLSDSDDDPLWNPNLEESFPHFRARARNVLDKVFAQNNASVKCKWSVDLGLVPWQLFLFVTSCFYNHSPRMERCIHGSIGTTRNHGQLWVERRRFVAFDTDFQVIFSSFVIRSIARHRSIHAAG